LSRAEGRRYEEIKAIQGMLSEGYAPVRIKEMLHTTYNKIRRYASGDPLKLCRFDGSRVSEAERYNKEIMDLLSKNTTFKQAREEIASLGYSGQRTAFEAYCRKLIAEAGIIYTPKRNSAGVPIKTQGKPVKRYVHRKDILKHIWSGKMLDETDEAFIYAKYGNLIEIQQCVVDFRKIYNEKSIDLLEAFVKRYSESKIKPIASFASGLRSDYEAVKNSVISELSNGFVEGINNKIKLIKRMMYGRAKLDLLRVRVVFAT